jgi:hypothetical protein
VVSDSGYVEQTAADTVDSNGAGTIDFQLVLSASPVFGAGSRMQLQKDFSVSPVGTISFGKGAEAGVMEVFALNGSLRFQRTVNRFATAITLPGNVIIRGETLVFKFSGSNFVNKKKVVLP